MTTAATPEPATGPTGDDGRTVGRISSIELLDPARGLFVSLTAGGNGAVFLRDEVIAAAAIPADGLSSFTAGTPLTLETERGLLEVELEPSGEPIRFRGSLVGERDIVRADARGRITDAGEEIAINGAGVIHSTGREPSPDSLRRDLTVMLDQGGLLCVATAGPAGSWCHGEEETVAAITHPGGQFDFGRALVSTSSDVAGRQQRATLELLPARDDVAVLHGAGHSVAGCSNRIGGRTVNTALFHWLVDGHRGAGRYELTRPDRREDPES